MNEDRPVRQRQRCNPLNVLFNINMFLALICRGFFASDLHTRTTVARLTLALARLSCKQSRWAMWQVRWY